MKKRLDVLLVEKGLAGSREKAKAIRSKRDLPDPVRRRKPLSCRGSST